MSKRTLAAVLALALAGIGLGCAGTVNDVMADPANGVFGNLSTSCGTGLADPIERDWIASLCSQ